jgi:cytochrome P450
MVENHSELLQLNLGAGSFYLATKPEHVQHILHDNVDNYWKGRIFNRMRFVFGDSLVLSEGKQWREQRRLLQPAFGPRRVRSLVPQICALVEKRFEKWEQACAHAEPLNIAEEMRVLSMRIGATAMFNTDVSDELSDTIAAAFDIFLQNIPVRFFTFFLPEWIKVPGHGKSQRAMQRIHDIVAGFVAERRSRGGGDQDDLLSLLINAIDQQTGDPRVQAERLLRDHVVTTMFGGYESTATALTWTWCLLSRHPEVARRVRAEVDAVLGNAEVTHDALAGLEYTQMAIEESLRLYPPFWESFRTAYHADVIDGTEIPAGASFLLCPYATQRDPRLWSNPDAFDPERFSSAQRRAQHRFAYFPFLEGQRVCIGRPFSLTEMKTVIAMTIRRYRFDLLSGYVMASRAEGTVRPRHTPWIQVCRH